MPWCGYWGTTGPAYWWLLPLIGLVFMAIVLFACFRGVGCMGGWRRRFAADDHPAPRRPEEEARESERSRDPS